MRSAGGNLISEAFSRYKPGQGIIVLRVHHGARKYIRDRSLNTRQRLFKHIMV